jgi:ATP-binding cassette subfamily F protein 3
MLKVSNLTIQYVKLLFSDLSFILGNNEKVGLIGFNGTGKSTLLRIIAGLEQPDKGKIELINERCGYLPQEFDFTADFAKNTLVGEVLESFVDDPRTEMYKVTKALSRLEFLDVDFYQEVDTLSHGQKMKLYLAKLLVQQATILLLDEPTNHLDIYGILWLEKFIKQFEGMCIIVSHDRAFLNGVVDKIFEIDEQKLEIFEGNYDDYLEQKDLLVEKRETSFRLQEKKRQKFEDMLVLIRKQSSGKKQASALKSVRTKIAREIDAKEISAYKEQKIKGLELKGATHSSKLVVKVQHLDFHYAAGKPLFEDAELEIFGKERVWFYGANGIGKSTLVKLITQELKPDNGKVAIGDNIRWVYFSQDQSHLPYDLTVEEYFLQKAGVDYQRSFGILRNFMFDKDMRKVKISKLSPGQRARLSFAVFSQKEYDFMILDEPTNHLDIKSKEVIEEALRDFQGSILLISHDRYFVEGLGMDRMITLDGQKIIQK